MWYSRCYPSHNAMSASAPVIPEVTVEEEVPVEEPRVPASVRRFEMSVLLLGSAVLGHAIIQWNSADLIQFLTFTGFALLVSGARIESPSGTGGLPMVFVLTLFSVSAFTVTEAVVAAGLCALVHGLWLQRNSDEPVYLGFHIALAMIATHIAYRAYSSPLLSSQDWETAFRFAAATLALVLVTTTGEALMTCLDSEESFYSVWGQQYLWRLPYYAVGCVLALLMSVAVHMVGWQTVLLSGPAIYLICRSYQHYVTRLEAEKRHAEDIADVHLRTIQALALAIEAKDTTTGVHLQRVQVYAEEIGKELGLDKDDLQALRAASLLHDIGKLAVPEHIISKPGRLTPEEFEKMKIHPIVGAEILERVRFPYPVVPIVRAHHEKWDGSGYPYGLKGEEIPIGARILSAVDCVDALASDRQYRRAIPIEQALDIVRAEAGGAFDPQVVEVLCSRFEELERKASQPSRTGAQLSTDVKVALGEAPAAGFENAGPETDVDSHRPSKDPSPFLNSIASARQEVQTLFEISQHLGNSLSLDETLSVLNVRLRRIIPHHLLAIWLKREHTLEPVYANGEECMLFSSLQIPIGNGLSGWVAANGKPIVNGNPSVEPGYLQDPNVKSSLHSALAVPLENSSGDIVGVMSLYHMDRDAFTRDHLRIMSAISPKIGVSIENSLKYQQVESSATKDYMTSLPNARSLFLQLDEELKRAAHDKRSLSIAVLDMDGLKMINDELGHLEGNRILGEVAKGLQSSCRNSDYVARMGGDEFVVLLPGLDADASVGRIHQLRQVIARVGQGARLSSPLSASIGIACFPQDGEEAEQLLQEADKRMYQEKRMRKNARTTIPQADWAEQLAAIHFQ